MSALIEIVTRYRAALLKRERDAVLRLTREYVAVWRALKASLDELLQMAGSQGDTVDTAWLYRQDRYQALMRQVEHETQTWARRAGLSAHDLQKFGLSFGQLYFFDTTGIGWMTESSVLVPLPKAAIETMAGMAADGSPLARLFDGIGKLVRAEWEKALAYGITAGKSPRVIAQMAHEATATGLARSMTIARTEMLRAFRLSAHETARRNSGVISGWVWCAALSTETCVACIAMNGTVHSMDEDFNDHPNGRCTALYITPGMNKDDILQRIPDAEKWLKTLDDKKLAQVFGTGAAEVWKSGRLPLRKFAALHRNDIWGDTYQPTPLYKLLGEL